MQSDDSFAIKCAATPDVCALGEEWGQRFIQQQVIPVISCEGGCFRGEVARQAAHLVAQEEPFRRGCHGEMFTVPDSAIAEWMRQAPKVVVIDGCYIHCHGRVMQNLVEPERLAVFDALAIFNKHVDAIAIESVPEEERKQLARQVADSVLAELRAQDGRAQPEKRSRL